MEDTNEERPNPTKINYEEIKNRFGYHRPTLAAQEKHVAVREGFRGFAAYLNSVLPEGRAKAVAFTELENCSMWAHKAIAGLSPVVDD